jgi:hypothetical protein
MTDDRHVNRTGPGEENPDEIAMTSQSGKSANQAEVMARLYAAVTISYVRRPLEYSCTELRRVVRRLRVVDVRDFAPRLLRCTGDALERAD